jgi:hypothetical protein
MEVVMKEISKMVRLMEKVKENTQKDLFIKVKCIMGRETVMVK